MNRFSLPFISRDGQVFSVLFLIIAFSSGCTLSDNYIVSSATLQSKSPTYSQLVTPSMTQNLNQTITPTTTQLPIFSIENQNYYEFDSPENILVSVSPGIAQWYDISYLDLPGDEQLNCITCDVIVSYNTGIDDEAKFWSPSWSPDGINYVYGVLSETRDYLSVDGIILKQAYSDKVLVSGENAWYDSLDWSPRRATHCLQQE